MCKQSGYHFPHFMTPETAWAWTINVWRRDMKCICSTWGQSLMQLVTRIPAPASPHWRTIDWPGRYESWISTEPHGSTRRTGSGFSILFIFCPSFCFLLYFWVSSFIYIDAIRFPSILHGGTLSIDCSMDWLSNGGPRCNKRCPDFNMFGVN